MFSGQRRSARRCKISDTDIPQACSSSANGCISYLRIRLTSSTHTPRKPIFRSQHVEVKMDVSSELTKMSLDKNPGDEQLQEKLLDLRIVSTESKLENENAQQSDAAYPFEFEKRPQSSDFETRTQRRIILEQPADVPNSALAAEYMRVQCDVRLAKAKMDEAEADYHNLLYYVDDDDGDDEEYSDGECSDDFVTLEQQMVALLVHRVIPTTRRYFDKLQYGRDMWMCHYDVANAEDIQDEEFQQLTREIEHVRLKLLSLRDTVKDLKSSAISILLHMRTSQQASAVNAKELESPPVRRSKMTKRQRRRQKKKARAMAKPKPTI